MQEAVSVRNAYKRYTSHSFVLQGLNMSVQRGSIYALLGPSGCGKTTLLSCVVGRMVLDSGTIITTAKTQKDIGYMPQTTALYMQLSIQETFAYYGRVYGLSWREIDVQSFNISRLLELPPPYRIVDTLSGGQQRRVSLAVSLIHNPDILILDEPTVGLDPLLSESIWKHLLRLSSEEKKTIVITTHYIEEASQASKVGLMRGGVLLCEETPADLMRINDCDSMESAFLKLSYKQETSKTDEKVSSVPSQKSFSTIKKGSMFSRRCFMAELIKNWFFVWRNKPMLLFLFGLPLAISFLFNMAIGHHPEGLRLGVLNHEVTNGISDCFNTPLIGCNYTYPFGCRFIRKLQADGILLVNYNNLNDAMAAARRNEMWGVIEVPENYTASVLERLEYNMKTKDKAVDRSTINVWLDMSNQNIGMLLKLNVLHSHFRFLETLYEDCGWPADAVGVPMKMGEPIYGEKVANLNHYASPAIIILLVFYLPMSYTIGVLVQEKLLGVLERSIVAGVTLIEVFIAHSVIQVILLSIQMSIAMFVLYYIYDSPFLGDPFGTASLLLLQGISGLAFGFLVALTFDKMLHATFASLGTVFSYFFLSGMVWPQAGLHYVLAWFRWLVPVSYSVEAMRALTARGWPVSHPLILKGYISVSSWIVLFCLGAFITIKLRKGSFAAV